MVDGRALCGVVRVCCNRDVLRQAGVLVVPQSHHTR